MYVCDQHGQVDHLILKQDCFPAIGKARFIYHNSEMCSKISMNCLPHDAKSCLADAHLVVFILNTLHHVLEIVTSRWDLRAHKSQVATAALLSQTLLEKAKHLETLIFL